MLAGEVQVRVAEDAELAKWFADMDAGGPHHTVPIDTTRDG